MSWKYYKNIVNVTHFLKFLHRFRQQHFFFPPIFGNDIAIIPFNFFSHFRQCHCHNYQIFFFFFSYFGNDIAVIAFFSQDGQEFGQRNFGNSIAEIPLLSLSNFFSFSLLFLLNFGNTVAEILSLSSICQLSSNSTYNAN